MVLQAVFQEATHLNAEIVAEIMVTVYAGLPSIMYSAGKVYRLLVKILAVSKISDPRKAHSPFELSICYVAGSSRSPLSHRQESLRVAECWLMTAVLCLVTAHLSSSY